MFILNSNQNPTQKNKLAVLFFILLIPLSSLLSIFGSFTVLDIVIIGFVLLSLSGVEKLKLPRALIIWILVGLLMVIIVSLFGSHGTSLTYDALFNAAQMLFIFTAVALAAQECTKYCSLSLLLNCVYVLAILSTFILLVSLYIDTPFVKYDERARYLPTFTGLTSIYTITLAFSAFQYLKADISFLRLVIVLSIVLLGTLCTGQRSMMLSFILITGFIFFKKNSMLVSLLVAVPLIFVAIELYSLIVESFDRTSLRVIATLLEDSDRIDILDAFFGAIYEYPLSLFIGLGIESWTLEGQEVHMQIFHLITDYGVFLMLSYFYIVYRFVFFCFDTNTEVRLFAIILTISLLPFVLFHTYSLERGHIFLFILVGAYFSDMKNFRERHCGIA